MDGVAPNGYKSGTGQTITINANNGCSSKTVDADTYVSWEVVGSGLGKQNSAYRLSNANCN